MKAISLYQPQATWVALKWKTIETRTHHRFKSLEGKRIVIHATQKTDVTAFKNRYFLDRAVYTPEMANYRKYLAMSGRLLCTARVVNARWAPNVGFNLREE